MNIFLKGCNIYGKCKHKGKIDGSKYHRGMLVEQLGKIPSFLQKTEKYDKRTINISSRLVAKFFKCLFGCKTSLSFGHAYSSFSSNIKGTNIPFIIF